MAKDFIVNNGVMSTTVAVNAPNVRYVNYILNADAEVDTTGWSTYAESDSVTFQDTGDTVTLNAHTLQNGNAVAFTSITSTTGISTNTLYYVVNAATNTFQLATSVGGSALALTTNGSGTLVRSLPKAGTGGTPQSNLWIRSTTTPLRGAASFRIDKTGSANREGQGVSYAFTLDKADQAKVLTVSFDYEVASGTYTDGDVTVYLYDVTNSVLIQPAGYIVQSVTSGTENKHIATFQTSATGTSYRLLFHISKPSTSDYALALDNITVGPQVVQYGAPMTDWVAWSPTGAWTSNTTYTGFYRRVGDSLEATVLVSASGAPNSSGLTVNMPTGLSIDTAKLTRTGGLFQPLGFGFINDSDGQAYPAYADLSATNTIRVLYSRADTTYTNNAQVSNTVPFTFGSGDNVQFRFSVPIQGWSSTVQMSNDTDTRVVAAQFGISTTNLTITASTVIVYPTVFYDTHGAYNASTGTYTAPVPGYYEIYSSEFSATGTVYVFFYKNNVQTGTINYYISTTYSGPSTGQGIVYLNGGDTITFKPHANSAIAYASGFYQNKITIKRVSGPSVVAATDLVAASYSSTATTATNSNSDTLLKFETIRNDTHGAYNTSTGVYTVPVAGWYQIDGIVVTGAPTWTIGHRCNLLYYKNGSISKTLASTVCQASASFRGSASGSTKDYFNAGDTISFYVFTSVATTLQGVATEQWFSIARIK